MMIDLWTINKFLIRFNLVLVISVDDKLPTTLRLMLYSRWKRLFQNPPKSP